MKYNEAINMMLNDVNCGFTNLTASTEEYKEKVKAEITKAKCSIVTAKVFLGFVEEKMKTKEPIKLDSIMLEAAIFIGNGLGLDPSDYCEELRHKDSAELDKAAEFKG